MARLKELETGALPIGWEVKRIEEVYDFTNKPKHIDLESVKQIPFIPMSLIPDDSLFVKNYELRNIVDLSSGTYIENGDLLIAKITPSFENGKQAIVDFNHEYGYATTEVIPIKEQENISNKYYLYYYLLKSDIRSLLAGKMEGSTGRQRLSKSTLGETSIPFPAISEQNAIAAVLTKIQSAIEMQKKVIQTTAELKKALMQKLFTEGLKGEPQKETDIGLMPKNWEVRDIRDLILDTETRNPEKEPAKQIKYIDVSSVSNKAFCVIGCQDFIGKDAPGRARKVVNTSDVIFATVRPTLKRVAKISQEYDNEYCSTAFCVLRADNTKLDFEFLYQYLLTDSFMKEIGSLQSGASYPAVRDDDVMRMKIPHPDIDEQRAISIMLKRVDNKIDFAMKKNKVLQDLFKSMLHHLMTGQIRVGDLKLA